MGCGDLGFYEKQINSARKNLEEQNQFYWWILLAEALLEVSIARLNCTGPAPGRLVAVSKSLLNKKVLYSKHVTCHASDGV